MSDLLNLLHLGAAGLQAQTAGAAVASNNAANVNTEGYSRQRIDLRSQLAAPLVGGVRAGGASRYESNILSARVRGSAGALAMSTAFHQAVLNIEGAVAGSGSLGGDVGRLFGAFGAIAAAPLDDSLRDAGVAAARELAASIHQRNAAVAQARADADVRIRENAGKASDLAQQIADANRSIKIADDPVMRDRRDQAATELSGLVGGQARVDPDGQMRFVLEGGAVMVDGNRAARLETAPDAAFGGYRRVEVVDGNSRRDVTIDLAGATNGGAIAGELVARDVVGGKAQNDLDQLAFDLTSQVNTVHRANAGRDGVTGRDLFVQPTAVAGAAAAMTVDPAVDADSRLLAVAAPGSGAGDNRGALALLDLRDQPLAGGGTRTFTDQAIEFGAGVGRTAASAGRDREIRETVHEGLIGMRDSLAGVSIEEELSKLSQFQHATEAMTRFISTVDQMLGDIIERI